MTPIHKCVAAAAAVAALAAAAPGLARDHAGQSLHIADAWCPPTPPGAPTAAGYLTITNRARAPDRLLGGSSPAAAQVQLHSMTTQGGVMRMRALDGLAVGGGQTARIQPGAGLHLMLIGLKRPLHAGDRVPVFLDFARAGKVRTDFLVRSDPGEASPHGHAMDQMRMGGR